MSLCEYIRDGAAAGGNSVPHRMLGFYLHWRTWATTITIGASFLLAGWAAQYWGWVAAWFVAMLTCVGVLQPIEERAEEVSDA